MEEYRLENYEPGPADPKTGIVDDAPRFEAMVEDTKGLDRENMSIVLDTQLWHVSRPVEVIAHRSNISPIHIRGTGSFDEDILTLSGNHSSFGTVYIRNGGSVHDSRTHGRGAAVLQAESATFEGWETDGLGLSGLRTLGYGRQINTDFGRFQCNDIGAALGLVKPHSSRPEDVFTDHEPLGPNGDVHQASKLAINLAAIPWNRWIQPYQLIVVAGYPRIISNLSLSEGWVEVYPRIPDAIKEGEVLWGHGVGVEHLGGDCAGSGFSGGIHGWRVAELLRTGAYMGLIASLTADVGVGSPLSIGGTQHGFHNAGHIGTYHREVSGVRFSMINYTRDKSVDITIAAQTGFDPTLAIGFAPKNAQGEDHNHSYPALHGIRVAYKGAILTATGVELADGELPGKLIVSNEPHLNHGCVRAKHPTVQLQFVEGMGLWKDLQARIFVARDGDELPEGLTVVVPEGHPPLRIQTHNAAGALVWVNTREHTWMFPDHEADVAFTYSPKTKTWGVSVSPFYTAA